MEVTIFDKPSGEIRGFAIETMMFPKGKSMVEKRICHANIFQNLPSDGVSIDAPKRMTPDQMREFAAKLVAFADEVEVQYAMPRSAMTYNEVMDGYERILKSNPGKALKLANGEVVIIHDGAVLGAPIDEDGSVNATDIYEFDPRLWDRKEGQWADDESWEQTARVITNPVLIDYKVDLLR